MKFIFLTYSIEVSCHLRPSPTENSSFRNFDESSLFVVCRRRRRVLFLAGKAFWVIFSSRAINVIKFDSVKSFALSDACTLDELLSFNEFVDFWWHSLGSHSDIIFLSSVFIGIIGSGWGEEFVPVGFVVDVDDEEFFSVEVDDERFWLVDVVDEELFLDDAADDWTFELLKSAFDDAIETGSEADDNDDPGRLLLSIWDFDRWCISSRVTEFFEDVRDKLLKDNLRNETKFLIVWSCSVDWFSNACFHSFDVEHSRIAGGGGGGGDGIICRGKTSVKNPPSPVSLEDAELIRLSLYNEFVKLNGEFRRGVAIVEFIQKTWVDDWSLADRIGGTFSDK